MPTVNLLRDDLFAFMGRTFTEEAFGQLCFEFGIELDEATSDYEMTRLERGEEAARGKSKEVIYKIDVPANRYDLLCLEGIGRALNIFLEEEKPPQYTVTKPAQLLEMHVKSETKAVREFVVCCVLRNITFDEPRYLRFIELQEKLHQNVCRRRTLVSMGTHDLDSIQGPFTYEALPQKDIKFQPLSEEKEFAVDELFQYYKNKPGCHLKPYLSITESFPLHPAIYDKNRVLLSLPPIINGEHSKVSLKTKDVFIEITATDHTKAHIALNTVIAMFSGYCAQPFTVEPVRVIYDDHEEITPILDDKVFEAAVSYINSVIGVDLDGPGMARILTRMQLPSTCVLNEKGEEVVRVQAPVTRSDILHACDIAEDVAIAHGYSNLKRTYPKCATLGAQQPVNALTDLLRQTVAEAGFMEVLTWVLSCVPDNFTLLNRPDDGSAVVIANPSTQEFTIVRTALLPGLLKTLSANKAHSLPVRIFEAGDVCLLDNSKDVGAKNSRRLAALYCGLKSGFEEIHSLVDRVMEANAVAFNPNWEEEKKDGENPQLEYYYKPSDDPAFFEGRRADVYVSGHKVGQFGIIHPKTISAFGLTCPCSAMELDIQSFLTMPS